ncbi:MAG: SDR family oxidoreductase [Haliscomenobacter sp.]|nr:SDR family oxidoreductase [Haliscomenobacter sp.]
MTNNFQGKVAFITGAGQGIGLQIAKQLVQEGAVVYLNDRDESLAQRASENLQAEGGHCIPLSGDVSEVERITSFIQQIKKEHGRLDIAIANAGITLFGDFLTYSEADFNQVLAVNLRGTFFLAQQATLVMKEQSTGGTLLFLSSVTAHQAHKNLGAYGMTKAAIELLARNLVAEISTYNINVNCLAPGATLTERTLLDEDYLETWSRITPMGKPASVEDIANAALFLVSDKAKHLTGQTLVVDGGWTVVSPSPY